MAVKNHNFKAKHHEEDSYSIISGKYGGVKVHQMMESGLVRSFYLTREAVEELYTEYLKSKSEANYFE